MAPLFLIVNEESKHTDGVVCVFVFCNSNTSGGILGIDTGDVAWYVMVAIEMLFLNDYSRYMFILKKISI